MDRKQAQEYLIDEFPHLEQLPYAIDLILDAIEKNLTPEDIRERYNDKVKEDTFSKKETVNDDVKVQDIEDKLNDLAIKSAFKDF
tara:strand:- start:1381 stop:1635 length:255 start_codon:yes stop_codon:yes gene_type:complete